MTNGNDLTAIYKSGYFVGELFFNTSQEAAKYIEKQKLLNLCAKYGNSEDKRDAMVSEILTTYNMIEKAVINATFDNEIEALKNI